MRVLIVAYGSRGDVQPFAALACELTRRGHTAILAGPPSAKALISETSVEFSCLDGGIGDLLSQQDIREVIDTNYRSLLNARKARRFIRAYRSVMSHVLTDLAQAASGCEADIVVYHPDLPGDAVAQRIGALAVPVSLQPNRVPTRYFPNASCPISVPRLLHRTSYAWTPFKTWCLRGPLSHWRKHLLGMPQRPYRWLTRRPEQDVRCVLHAFSSQVVPTPPDYPPWVHTTGFWYLPADRSSVPPQELVDFTASDEPVVYVGFGSMAGTDPDRTARVVSEALQISQVRAVIAGGWGGIAPDSLGADVLYLPEVRHDWLFARVDAIVHHGGSGTTGAALAAGQPQVVCPYIGDQLFFARRMHSLGVAPEPQYQRELDARPLAHAIRSVLDKPCYSHRAKTLEKVTANEDGVSTAVHILESLAPSS